MDYSVVIPVHNGERYVGRAIRSALQQAPVSPTDVVVVSDGSTDRSADVAAACGPLVTVVAHDTPRGPSEARNYGIRTARSDVIAFLDADDEWKERKIERQLALLQSHPELIAVFSDFHTVAPTGQPAEGWQGGLLEQLVNHGLAPKPVGDRQYVLKGAVAEALVRYSSFIHPSTMVVRRSALASVGYFDPTFSAAEDLDLWIRLALAGAIGYVDERFVAVESRPDSQGRKKINMCEHVVRLYAAMPGRMPAMPDTLRQYVKQVLHEQYATLGWLYMHERHDLTRSRAAYTEALRLRWSWPIASSLAKVATASLLPASLWRRKSQSRARQVR